MTLGEDVFDVASGDSILIPPGTPQSIEATGEESVRILFSCRPAYSHAP
jgi:mannose-6-phosphate isomerase-like protein (cupin superfamily)